MNIRYLLLSKQLPFVFVGIYVYLLLITLFLILQAQNFSSQRFKFFIFFFNILFNLINFTLDSFDWSVSVKFTGSDGRVACSGTFVAGRAIFFYLFWFSGIILSLDEKSLYFLPGLVAKDGHGHSKIVKFFLCPSIYSVESILWQVKVVHWWIVRWFI